MPKAIRRDGATLQWLTSTVTLEKLKGLQLPSKPLMVDLFCGLGGWAEGGLAENWHVIGFDIERHDYGDGAKYPAQLVLQDVLTIHGRQFKDAALIVASPPCQEYSYMAMPWSKAKAIAAEYRSGARDTKKLTALFDACFRIQCEASEAAGHHIPMVVENVRGACPWVGRSRWNYGSYHLWGDVPALMPMTYKGLKCDAETGFKSQGLNWSDRSIKGQDFTRVAGAQADGRKNDGGSWFNIGSPGQKETNRNPVHDHIKCGGDWFNDTEPSISRTTGSKSKARKAASAAIAKIPFALSRYIAAHFKPMEIAA